MQTEKIKVNTLHSFTLLILILLPQGYHSQIIGSSVVTSVSVVLGNDNNRDETTTLPLEGGGGDDENVLSVLATLKNIVAEKEKEKHNNNGAQSDSSALPPPPTSSKEKYRRPVATSNPVQSSDESPPLSRNEGHSTLKNKKKQNQSMKKKESVSGFDDDDEDDDGPEMDIVVTLSPSTSSSNKKKSKPKPTKTQNHAMMGGMKNSKQPQNNNPKPLPLLTNDTATSAEVNEAIHKLSGAILSARPAPAFKGKPIENIVDDVLSSINDSRKSSTTSTTTTPRPKKSQKVTKRPKPSSQTTAAQMDTDNDKFTSRASPSAILAKYTPTTTSAPPMYRPSSEIEIGETKVNQPSQDFVSEEISSEDFEEEFTTIRPPIRSRPRPTKAPLLYHSSSKNNFTTSSNRPNDFYDDEIFGYDPYQTFLHGVYVPIVPEGQAQETPQTPQITYNGENKIILKDSESITTTCKPAGGVTYPAIANKISVKSQLPTTSKPVPSLPDHLHRPRPSHLQYQHGAIHKNQDYESGAVTTKPPRYTTGGFEDHYSPDKFKVLPRPIVPKPVVQNYSDVHHEAHHGEGHHHGGGHGHGSHGHDHSGGHDHAGGHHHLQFGQTNEKRPEFPAAPTGNPGLEATVTNVNEEMRAFVEINNKLALRMFSSLTNPVSKSAESYENMVMSPFTIISSLAMMFLGARATTATQLDSLLQLDDMITFNPHMIYRNVTQSFLSQSNTAAAMIRLLIADKNKGDVLDFFKTRVQNFYDARVEEADYKFAGHLAQSIINQMIRAQIQRHSYEMLNYSLPLKGPLSLLTALFFDGEFAGEKDTSVNEMHFIHLAALGRSARRLIEVPAVSFKGQMTAAYDKELDATAIEVPYKTRELSLILIMPGKPGEFAIGGVTSLKSRLTLDTWKGLMRGFFPRDRFKVVFPRFKHQSSLNLTYTMKRFGLTDMFSPQLSKFKGINGLSDLHLDQNMMHFTEFGTWEKLADSPTENNSPQPHNKNLDLIRILRPHVREHYGNFGEPMTVKDWLFMSRTPAQYSSSSTFGTLNSSPNKEFHQFFSSHPNPSVQGDVRSKNKKRTAPQSQSQNEQNNKGRPRRRTYINQWMNGGGEMSPRKLLSKKYLFSRQTSRQETTPPPSEDEPVLRFERPFIYVVRHNPTGLILLTGQYTEPVTEVLQD